jgi:cobalt-zinc-cadmium resistance protein CzcA
MVDKLIEFSLHRPLLILTFAGLLTLLGGYAFRTISIDAFPDVTSVLVQIVTKAPGLSPEEVERLVTFPIEQQVTGVPHLTELRSLTKVGLSLITVVFDDHMDINLARQLVLERLIEVREHLPPGSEPMMTPNSTGLGEVYQYYLESPRHGGLDAVLDQRDLERGELIQHLELLALRGHLLLQRNELLLGRPLRLLTCRRGGHVHGRGNHRDPNKHQETLHRPSC